LRMARIRWKAKQKTKTNSSPARNTITTESEEQATENVHQSKRD